VRLSSGPLLTVELDLNEPASRLRFRLGHLSGRRQRLRGQLSRGPDLHPLLIPCQHLLNLSKRQAGLFFGNEFVCDPSPFGSVLVGRFNGSVAVEALPLPKAS
jgi:hypothetical protein